MQAWKKTASYLRQHSWYADTLELDYAHTRNINLVSADMGNSSDMVEKHYKRVIPSSAAEEFWAIKPT